MNKLGENTNCNIICKSLVSLNKNVEIFDLRNSMYVHCIYNYVKENQLKLGPHKKLHFKAL
jgi:hypothetical protein